MITISLDKLIDMWTNEDSVIDSTEPQKALLAIPRLHAKYVAQISAHSAALKMKNLDYTVLRKKKLDYYSGRMSEADLKANGWEPFRFLLKSDMESYLQADPDIIEAKRKMINNEEAMEFCRSVVKELSNRTWQLRDYMAWERFISGQ
jgi:hypothetical protein